MWIGKILSSIFKIIIYETCTNRQLKSYFQNVLNPLLVLLRKTGFFDRIYTRVYGKTKFRF